MTTLGLGLGLQHNPFGAGIPLFSGILDTYPGAAAAYSLRALSSGWLAGDVVEVRRSSDSTTQDFTASQILNGDLETFCGVGDGFVSTWYDQSGNANDATQATTTAQPKIVDAGSLVTGGLDFDGVDDDLSLTQIDFNNGEFLYSVVIDYDGTDSVILGNGSTLWTMRLTSSVNLSLRTSNGPTIHNITLNTPVSTSATSLITVFRVGDDITVAINGTPQTDVATVATASTFKIDKIGSRSSQYNNSPLAEINIWDSDQSANRVGIETNINDFYSIY